MATVAVAQSAMRCKTVLLYSLHSGDTWPLQTRPSRTLSCTQGSRSRRLPVLGVIPIPVVRSFAVVAWRVAVTHVVLLNPMLNKTFVT